MFHSLLCFTMKAELRVAAENVFRTEVRPWWTWALNYSPSTALAEPTRNSIAST